MLLILNPPLCTRLDAATTVHWMRNGFQADLFNFTPGMAVYRFLSMYLCLSRLFSLILAYPANAHLTKEMIVLVTTLVCETLLFNLGYQLDGGYKDPWQLDLVIPI